MLGVAAEAACLDVALVVAGRTLISAKRPMQMRESNFRLKNNCQKGRCIYSQQQSHACTQVREFQKPFWKIFWRVGSRLVHQKTKILEPIAFFESRNRSGFYGN